MPTTGQTWLQNNAGLSPTAASWTYAGIQIATSFGDVYGACTIANSEITIEGAGVVAGGGNSNIVLSNNTIGNGIIGQSTANTTTGVAVPTQLAINSAVGAQAEIDAVTDFSNQSLAVSQRISLTGSAVRAVGDIGLNGQPGATVQIPLGFNAEDLAGNPLLDANGNPITSFQLNSQGQAVVEVKTGDATLTPNQATVYPIVQSGGAKGVGGNAANAGIAGPMQPTPVIVIRR